MITEINQREVLDTAEKNKLKPDTILKNFWRDNRHFADLFNAVFFNGEQVLKPQDLTEADTDVSSMLKFNGHAETVQKILDVVKKTAYGVDFVLWGLENQAKIHYAMPLRHMVGDAFSYMKEYDEIAAVNKKNGDFHSSDEFLSGFKKTDRLHPVISLCVYYGESEWDGPFSLKDMLEIPEKIESQKLINHALELEQRGGKINMCNALEELRQEGVEEGRQEGRQEGRWEGILEGIRATVRTCRNFNISEADTIRNIMNEFSLSQEEAVNYVKKYW